MWVKGMLPFGCTVFATVCSPSPFCSFVTENATILPSSQQSPQRRPRHKSPIPGFEEIGFHNAVSHSRCHLITGNDSRSFSCGTSFSRDGICFPPTQQHRDQHLRLWKKNRQRGRKIKSGPSVKINTHTHTNTCRGNCGINKQNRGVF